MRTGSLVIFLASFVAVLTLSATAFATTNVTANLDPQTVEVGQPFDYVVEINSSESGRISFEPEPDFGELRLVGRQQRTSFRAGVGASRNFSFIFSLQASQTGKFTIGGPTVRVGNERFNVPDKTVEIVARGNAPTPKVDTDSPYALEVEISPDRDPYVGEQITVNYNLLRDARSPNAQPTIPNEPALDDFWTEDLTSSSSYQRRTVRSGGKLYEQISIRTYGLFPLKAGPAEIEPMTVDLQTGGFFRRPQTVTLRSKAKKLDVKPLPPNAPDGFVESNVGQWNFSTRVDHRATRVGRPVTFELVAEGQGHVERLNLPDLSELDGARITHRDVDQRRHRTSRVIGGRKVKRISVMPTRQGTLTIPSITFHHFDPEAGEYRTTETEPIEVRVAPGELPEETSQEKVEARAETEEEDVIGGLTESLEPPVPVAADSAPASKPFRTWWFWLLVGLPALALLGLWLESPLRRLRSESAPRRRRTASTGEAMARLTEAKSWDDVYTALRLFLEVRLDVPSGRITGDDIVDALEERGVETELGIRVERLLKKMEQARFGGAEATPTATEIDETKSLIESIAADSERLHLRGGSHVAIIFLVMLFFSASADVATAASPTSDPHQLWSNGDFAAAAEAFEDDLASAPDVAMNHFNVGTAHARAENIGAARLHLERAALLDPWDATIRSQLETVRRVVRLHSIEASRTGKTLDGDEPLFWWRFATQLWPPAVALFIILGLWLAAGSQTVRRFSSRPAIRDAAFVGLALGLTVTLLGMTAAGVRLVATSSVEPAVMMESPTVHAGPSEHAEVLDLPKSAVPGTVVRVVERRDEWVKIALPGELEGWTKNGAIESIAPSETK